MHAAASSQPGQINRFRKVRYADRSETKIYDLVLFRNHSKNSMTHISVVTYGA
eukprot:COSAG01_NODE_38807_length_484_cov_76.644156_1_plen_52_part_01